MLKHKAFHNSHYIIRTYSVTNMEEEGRGKQQYLALEGALTSLAPQDCET